MKKLSFFLMAMLIPLLGLASDQYYLIGDATDWKHDMEGYRFTDSGNGIYRLELASLPQGSIKIAKGGVTGDTSWENLSFNAGGGADVTLGAVHKIYKNGGNSKITENLTDVVLTLDTTATGDTDQVGTLLISTPDVYYLIGQVSDWKFSDKFKLTDPDGDGVYTVNLNGYTINTTGDSGDGFKITKGAKWNEDQWCTNGNLLYANISYYTKKDSKGKNIKVNAEISNPTVSFNPKTGELRLVASSVGPVDPPVDPTVPEVYVWGSEHGWDDMYTITGESGSDIVRFTSDQVGFDIKKKRLGFHITFKDSDGKLWKFNQNEELSLDVPYGETTSITDNSAEEKFIAFNNTPMSKVYYITVDTKNRTILCSELDDEVVSYAVKGAFLVSDGDEWGAQLLNGPNTFGWYTGQIEVGEGGFVIEKLKGNTLNSPVEAVYGNRETAVTKSETVYLLSEGDLEKEDYAQMDINNGTYRFVFKPESNTLEVTPVEGYFLIGAFNDWSITEGYYTLFKQEDGTYYARVPRVFAANASIAVVKNLNLSNGVYQLTSGNVNKEFLTTDHAVTLVGPSKWVSSRAVKLGESMTIPEFTFDQSNKTLSVKIWENDDLYNNSSIASKYYKDNDLFLLKGTDVTVNGRAMSTGTSNANRVANGARFVESVNEKFPASEGWLVVKNVKFNKNDFSIIRAKNETNYPQVTADTEAEGGNKIGLIWAKNKYNTTVYDQLTTEAAYSNYPKPDKPGQKEGANFTAYQLGTYDIYFNPTSMQVILGGSYAWQMYGYVATGQLEAVAMNPEYTVVPEGSADIPQPTGRWTITIPECNRGEFRFRHSDPAESTGWKVIGSPVNTSNPNSHLVESSGKYYGATDDQEYWLSYLSGSHKFILDPDTNTLIVDNEEGDPIVSAEMLTMRFINGDEYWDTDGILQANGREPGDHSHGGKHGAYLEILYSDGSKQWLISDQGEADSVELGENQRLILSSTEAPIYFNLGEDMNNEKSKYNFIVNWRNIANATITVEQVGSSATGNKENYKWYRIHGNAWGTNNWNDLAIFEDTPDEDGWYVAKNVRFTGTNFGIKLTDAKGYQWDENGNTAYGWWFGNGNSTAANGYYINDGNNHECKNEPEYGTTKKKVEYLDKFGNKVEEEIEVSNGHNFVLGQPGTYDVYFNPEKALIRVVGSYKPVNNVTVYFADRKFGHVNKINNVHAYVYNNDGVDPNGGLNSLEDVLTPWGGDNMTKLDSTHALYELVDGEDVEIYSYTFDMNRFPRIIFNDGHDKKTRNLAVVANGVYYLDEDLLPSNYYLAASGSAEAELLPYPNDYSNTPVNTIYVDVPAFVNYAKDNADNKISFSISWEKDGHTFITTGIRGTTNGVVETFPNGKEYIALTLTEASIPSGTPMRIYIWEGDNKYKFATCGVEGHNHSVFDGEDGNCDNVDRPLAFETIEFVDGGVYRRGQSAPNSIFEEIQPDEVWIVESTTGSLKTVSTSSNGADQPVASVQLDPETEVGEATLTYSMRDVTVDSKFLFKVRIGSNWYWYTNNESETDNTTRTMRAANRYDAISHEGEDQPSGDYAIRQQWSHIKAYTVTFDWMRHDVYVMPQSSEPDFTILHIDPAFQGNQHFVVRAVANDKDAGTGVAGIAIKRPGSDEVETLVQKHTTLIVGHKAEFGGNSSVNDDHYEAVTTTVTPETTYESYFGAKSGNYKPHYTRLAPRENFEADNSELSVKAYTAGWYNVSVSVPNIEEQSGEGKVVTFKRQKKTFRMIVTPTVSSIGLAINGNGICPMIEGNAAYTGNESLFMVYDPKPTRNYETGNRNDGSYVIWNPEKRVCMEANMADGNNVEIYYRVVKRADEDVNTVFYAPRSVVRRDAGTDTGVYSDPDTTSEDGYTKYNMWNSLNNEKLGFTAEDKNEDAESKNAVVEFVVKQNGIVGEPQRVNVFAKTPTNLPTDIEEIEMPSEDEVLGNETEAVYYDINGIRVDAEELVPGVYVVVKGDKTEKIYVK